LIAMDSEVDAPFGVTAAAKDDAPRKKQAIDTHGLISTVRPPRKISAAC
jgi:hypothetical protein